MNLAQLVPSSVALPAELVIVVVIHVNPRNKTLKFGHNQSVKAEML